jgi:hypothetical protein
MNKQTKTKAIRGVAQVEEALNSTPSTAKQKQKTSHPWKCTPVITATKKAEVGGSQPEAGPSKTMRPYLKNKHD